MPKIRRDAARLVYNGWSTRKVARHFGFSRSVIVKSHPKELSKEIVNKIIAKRLEHNRYAEAVHKEIENDGVVVSLLSVKRTLERNYLIKKRSPMIQSDHGTEFGKWFVSRIRKNHRYTRIGKPNDNSHIERFNRTLQEECLDKIETDVNKINFALKEYLRYYNYERVHGGINYQIPIQLITK